MTDKDALKELRTKADAISKHVTSMHPDVAKLGQSEHQDAVYRALFELTRQVEVVKKHLLKLEKKDGSTDL